MSVYNFFSSTRPERLSFFTLTRARESKKIKLGVISR